MYRFSLLSTKPLKFRAQSALFLMILLALALVAPVWAQSGSSSSSSPSAQSSTPQQQQPEAPEAGGHFLGDYIGLKATSQTVWPVFGQATGVNLTDLFTRQITVRMIAPLAAK